MSDRTEPTNWKALEGDIRAHGVKLCPEKLDGVVLGGPGMITKVRVPSSCLGPIQGLKGGLTF